MTDQDIKQSLTEQFLAERLYQYEKLFAGPLWKKSLQPYLKALYEMSLRSVLQETDHTRSDIQKGRALALENIMNLPKFIEYLQSMKTNPSQGHPEAKLSGPITDYEGDFADEIHVEE